MQTYVISRAVCPSVCLSVREWLARRAASSSNAVMQR